MSDLNYDVESELAKYMDAYDLQGVSIPTTKMPNSPRRYNPMTGKNDVLTQMQNGGYVRIGTEPVAMTQAPKQPTLPETDQPPTGGLGPQVEGAQKLARDMQEMRGSYEIADLEAAGYSPEVIKAAGLDVQPTMPESRIEPLSEQEVRDVIASGQPIITADPTLRQEGSRVVSTYFFDLAVQGLREDLAEQGMGEDEIERTVKAREGELLRNAEVYSNALFGTGATGMEIGVGDFLQAGIMDIQEGRRLFNQQRDERGGSMAGRAIGMAIMAAGVAEATGVGYAFGKLLKRGAKALEPTLVRMGEEAQGRIDAEGMTLYSNPVGPIVDRGLAAAGRAAGGSEFTVTRQDASEIFGEGSERVRYTDPRSQGTIEIVARPDGSASILELEVPEEFRGQGIGQRLQEKVMQDYPVMGGQVSSKAAATTAYRLGRRPINNPDATLEDVFKEIDEMSSVNMISPKMRIAETRRQANIARFGYDPNNPVAEVKAPTEAEPGIIAFHGSGADFDKFSLDMIGTGEGSQAYGYGLYFTDTKSIAEFYKDAVREESNIIHLDGKPIDSVYSSDNEEKFSEYITENFEPDQFNDAYMVLDNLGQGISSVEDADSMAASSLTRPQMEIYNKIRNDLEVPELPEGKMYEVMINIQPENLLDYDKPLKSQPKEIQSAALRAAKSAGAYKGTDKKTLELSGGALLADMVNNIVIKQNLQGMTSEAEKIAAQELFGQGIPGIKYFDNASRNTADGTSLGAIETEQGFVGRVESTVPSMFGPTDPQRVLTRSKPYKTKEEAERWIEEAIGRNTRNYVVFDDKLVNIMKKYGIVGPVAVTAMKSEEQEET